MIAIRGIGSEIAKQLIDLLPHEEVVEPVERGARMPLGANRFLFCAGVLHGKRSLDMSDAEAAESFVVNAMSVIRECDRVVGQCDRARICVVGSESAFTWSYDAAYAASKAALHRYVETKRLRTPDQQLVCVAPGIIIDAGMTTRRKDMKNLADRMNRHPKGRFLEAIEVAKLVKFCLYDDRGFLNGVIRMNGNEHLA